MARSIQARITFDLKSFPAMFRKKEVRPIVQDTLDTFVISALKIGKVKAQQLTPVGATGNLKGSIITEFAKGRRALKVGFIRWTAPYSKTVDEGGPPRKVNISRLRAWSAAVLGDEDAARDVQKAIQLRGTPSPNHPNPGLGMTIRLADALSPIANTILSRSQEKLVERLVAQGKR